MKRASLSTTSLPVNTASLQKKSIALKKTILLTLILIISLALCAVAPVVTNATAAQRTDGSKIVDIYYDVACASDDSVWVAMSVSSDGGSTFAVTATPANLSGDTGKIHIGTGKHIIWNAGNEASPLDGNQFAFKVQAWDMQPVPENFVLVAGGTFNNGTSDVTLSSFYMSKYELTQAEYQATMGSNPASGYGVGASYPVYYVSWFNAIEYCNRRSITEGLTPCYSYSTFGTNPATWPGGWNTNDNNHTNVSCNWIANGYRLPTEAEWEFAARGGNQTHNYTYSGSNDINAVAWYNSNSGYTTHTIGTKAANELGIYDLSGNVWEWCWDVYSGSYRVHRGGSWSHNAADCAVSFRGGRYAAGSDYYIGFRCVRVSP